MPVAIVYFCKFPGGLKGVHDYTSDGSGYLDCKILRTFALGSINPWIVFWNLRAGLVAGSTGKGPFQYSSKTDLYWFFPYITQSPHCATVIVY